MHDDNMARLLFFLLCCVVSVWSVPSGKTFYELELADQFFNEFVETHSKKYESEHEKQTRFSIFKDNLKRINERNKKSKTAVFGINRFTDLTTEEVLQMYTGYRLNDPYECPPAHDSPDMTPPESLDWRDKNKVTRVKDQGNCGSCWAFSAVGNLEGQYAIKHNELQEFSEQQLVDCDKYDFGCGGGLMDHAFIWLQKNGGIELEKDYPYEGKDNKCNFDKSKAFATVSNCVRFNVTNNEEMLKQYLATTGPLAIAVDAMPMAAYTGGILDDCASNELNHGVLLVGYGTENGTPFWIIKNSWSETFGEKGYIRVKMSVNCCNLTAMVSSAIVD